MPTLKLEYIRLNFVEGRVIPSSVIGIAQNHGAFGLRTSHPSLTPFG